MFFAAPGHKAGLFRIWIYLVNRNWLLDLWPEDRPGAFLWSEKDGSRRLPPMLMQGGEPNTNGRAAP